MLPSVVADAPQRAETPNPSTPAVPLRKAAPLMPSPRHFQPAVFSLCLSILSAGCSPKEVTPPPFPPPAPTEQQLRDRIDDALLYTYTNRRLNLQDHAAWQILHGVLAYQQDFQVERGGDRQPAAAVQHLLSGGRMEGWAIEPGYRDQRTGRVGMRALLEEGSKTGQGHPDQWLAVLAQCGLAPDQTIQVGEDVYTMADWVRQVEWEAPRNSNQEYSWTLIGLTTYRPTTHRWTAADGQEWSIERLMEIELAQDIHASACGGTHRMIGLAMALNRHLAAGGEPAGVWRRADVAIQEKIADARRHQDRSGAFSANYFARPGRTPDLAVDLGATGHVLEFITLAASERQLREAWVEQAVLHLCDVFDTTRSLPLECGALYHAAHGLLVYRQRRFGPVNYAELAVQRATAADPAPAPPDGAPGRADPSL